MALFYTEKLHPEGSNYLAIYLRAIRTDGTRGCFITNGISAIEPFNGIEYNGNVIYSAYLHDYFDHDGVFVDGGRDYLRYGGAELSAIKPVKLQIIKDELKVIEWNAV